MYSFEGKVVLVTGSSSGIGKSIALGFSKLGATVVVHGNTNVSDAQKVVKQIEEQGGKALLVKGDVTNTQQVNQIIKKIELNFGKIDILVNNAGSMVKRCKIEDLDEETWDKIFNINIKSVFLVTKAVIPLMKKQKQGKIINVSSLAARNGGGIGAVAYASAKGGLSTFTRGLAKELVEDNILVNGIGPGFIATSFHDQFTPDAMRKSAPTHIPLGREGKPDEMVGAVLFLASDLASFITGEIIEINGGQLMD